MKVLLFGANGQVGFDCVSRFREAGFDLVALTREQVDLADADQVRKAIQRQKPDLVINAAAYTAVDKAESEADLAALINETAVEAMARACNEQRIPLFHISTDYVFDGTKEGAYRESDPVGPQGVYGRTKLAGETAIQKCLTHHIILRTAWVFGTHGQNFVKTMLRLGRERDTLGVVDDQRGCPTYAGHIADTLLTLAEHYRETGDLPWGLYHFSGDQPCTWYEFASAIFDLALETGLLSKLPTVNPIATSDYPTPAKRPANSVLDCHKIVSTGLGIQSGDWHAGLEEFINQASSI